MVSPAELRSYLNTRYDAEKSNKNTTRNIV